MISISFDTPGSMPRETSAAAQPAPHDAKILREQCLNLIKNRDLTADEVAKMMDKSVLSIRPRISELATSKKIFDSGKRRKNESGNSAIVWTVDPQASLL